MFLTTCHSFSPYGPTLGQQTTYLFFSFSKLFLQLITNGFVYATLSLNPVVCCLLTILKKRRNEQVTLIQ